jgi:hypothetical protein
MCHSLFVLRFTKIMVKRSVSSIMMMTYNDSVRKRNIMHEYSISPAAKVKGDKDGHISVQRNYLKLDI